MYDRLLPLVGSSARNRLRALVGRAAAALGAGEARQTLADLALAERLVDQPGAVDAASGLYHRRLLPVAPVAEARLDQRLLLWGLGAEAHFRLGELDEAAAAMTRRRDALAGRLGRDLDEDRLELAASESHLATYAYRRHAADEALGHVEAGLRRSDEWSARTGTPLHPVGLELLRAYAELRLHSALSADRFTLDLSKRLDDAFHKMSELRNPTWEPMRQRFAVYLTLLHLPWPGPARR